jgi:hypothetical protein
MDRNFNIKPFAYQGIEYTPVVNMHKGFVAVAPTPEGCCTRVAYGRPGAVDVKTVGGDGIDQVARFVARHVIHDSGFSTVAFPEMWPFWPEPATPIEMPPLSTKQVPGTSKGVQYYVLAETKHGRISRRGPEMLSSEARIRVTPSGDKSLHATYPPPFHNKDLMPHGMLNWSTNDNTHLAHNGTGREALRNVVCHAVNALLVLENGAWK